MSFWIISRSLSIYLLLLLFFNACYAGEFRVRDRRADQSNSFGHMFMDFLSNLFGSNTNVTNIVDKPVNESFNETLQNFATNVSTSVIETQENVSETNLIAQQGVTAQENRTKSSVNMTSSTETFNISSQTSAVTSMMTFPAGATVIEENTCNNEPLLRNYCQVPKNMYNVSLWDLYSIFFSDRIINTLLVACPRGNWCLQDDDDYWGSLIDERVSMVTGPSSILTTVCKTYFEPCLSYIVKKFEHCSTYPHFMVTVEALKLACVLQADRALTSLCYRQVVTALQVTIADQLRYEEQQDGNLDKCQSAEANMIKSLICVDNACPGESKTFQSFKPWAWFTSVEDDLMTECKLDPTKCDALLPNYCPVPEDMTDVSFWDLYSVFYSDTVLDALTVGCTKGSWCLQDRFDYWESLIVERVDIVIESEIAKSMCQPEIESCIVQMSNSFVNCSMYSQMVFTSEVLKLICGLKQNTDLTSSCYKHVITAVHVTLADILRSQEYDKNSEADDTCESPEAHMTQGLICVENSCPGESNTFHSFKPWAWFTAVVNDLIAECNFDPTTCQALLTPPPGYVGRSEMGTMVGISVAIMITALTLTVVVCTCYKRHRRNAVVKEGYQRLLTEGDES